MNNDWFNLESNDDFNPDDYGIEMDEIAKLYAIADMKESHQEWARIQADKFYQNFSDIDVPTAVSSIITMIKSKELEIDNVYTMLDNMISIFQDVEEYEKCHVCLQIKTELYDRI
jgi:hypothetical protein